MEHKRGLQLLFPHNHRILMRPKRDPHRFLLNRRSATVVPSIYRNLFGILGHRRHPDLTRSALLDNARVTKLFAHYRDQLSPLGAMPPYGDCYGWGFEWGGWLLLFETAATQIGDGTFKQAAARVFDFLVQEVKNEPRGFLWTSRNGARRLLVFFVPRQPMAAGCQYQAWKTQRAVQQWSPPYCLYQKQAGYMAAPALDPLDTILVPHGPAEDRAALAATIVAGDGPRRSIRLNLGGQSIAAIVDHGRPELKNTVPR